MSIGSGLTNSGLHVTALVLALLVSGGCGEVTQPTTSKSCSTLTAEILVGDSFQTIICGCDEAAGTRARLGETLQCTVALGSSVVFYLNANKACRRLVAQNDATSAQAFFPTSPCLKKASKQKTTVQMHSFTPQEKGTLSYTSNTEPQLMGKILVR